MADDPKTGGVGEVTTEPAAPSVPKTEPAGATETPEQRIARLEAENEAHRRTQAEWQPKVEQANRILAERANSPPTAQTPAVDPLDAEVAAAQAAEREYPNDPAYRAAAKLAIWERDAARQQRVQQQVAPMFTAMPEKFREKARELFWQARGAIHPDVALAAAKGQMGPDESEMDKLRKENEEVKKDLEARKRGVFTTGGSPVLEPKAQRTLTDGTAVYTKQEWAKLDTLPQAEKIKLLRAYKAGKVLVSQD